MENNQLITIDTLFEGNVVAAKQNALNMFLSHEPKKEWVKEHPIIKVRDEKDRLVAYKYLSIETVEYILTSVFNKWWVEIKEVKLIANSVVVMVRLWVINPLDGSEMFNDGTGASPIQIDKGEGAIDFQKMKPGAIQMAAPAAESYAVKDAAEKFGRLFGKDLNRKDVMNYVDYESKEDILKNKFEGKVNIEDIPEELEFIISEADATNLGNIYKTNPQYHTNKKFMDLLTKRKAEIKNGNVVAN